jgi:uncharacterized membrane protein
MSENNDEQEIYKARKVAYYGACVEAWITTNMERDKQILGLSSLALGGLIAFQQTLNDTTSFLLWLGASLIFISAIILALFILSLNAKYIEKLIKENVTPDDEKRMSLADGVLTVLFILGIVLTFSLAVKESGFSIYKQEAQQTSGENKNGKK